MKLSKKYELQGLIWKNLNENWCRNCPRCNNIIEHTGIWGKSGAARRCKNKIKCHVCAAKERLSPSNITRKKLSDSNKGKNLGKYHTEETKKKMSNNQTMRYFDSKEKWLKSLRQLSCNM
jgi:hypothetical protein